MSHVSGGNTAVEGESNTQLIKDTGDTEKDNKIDTNVTPKSVDTKDSSDIKDTPETVDVKDRNNKRSVSFNRDVHVKRFGKPREPRGASTEQNSIRKEPFTHLSEQELINEANKVIAQAQSVTCTADHPPDKFFSLPHRRKLKEDNKRRNSDDTTPEKTPLNRSTSDVSSKKRKERTSLSTLFRRAQRNKSPVEPVVVKTRPVAIVKRSKSDVTDLKSNTTLNTQTKPVRKRSGSETEEFLKSLRNKKSQLSPIIESSPREDYFKKTPPLEVFQKQKLSQKDSNKSDDKKEDKKINPLEKPPRYKTPEKDPKPPARTKRGKSADKEPSPPIADTPKRKTELKKTLLVDEIDSIKTPEIKDKIKESIRKIEENVYADRVMIHSSQQPPDKPPLTRGHTVDHMVKILREDQMGPPPKTHLIAPQNGSNINQPFSYTKPSVSPDANLFIRNSPDRIPSPINKMHDKGVIYAQVKRDERSNERTKETVHKTYSKEKFVNQSDEDEGLGYEDRYKYTNNRYDYEYKNKENTNFNTHDGYKLTDSPIRPRYREYKLTSFDDFEPTYANEYPTNDTRDSIDMFRGRADGMDNMKKSYEPETGKVDLDFNELSHRRQLLESRLNARRFDRERIVEEPVTRYLTEIDPIYEAEKRMQATERYVNETARYYQHTLEKDGYADSNVTEEYSKYDSDNKKIKYNTESRSYSKVPKDEVDRREYIDQLDPRYKDVKDFPPEPEYEPPSLESNVAKSDIKEKKYKVKKHLTSSQDALQTGQKYKRDEYFGKRKGHYSSNPEIAQEREEQYANLPKYSESYHNSLRRVKNKDRYREDFTIRRHDSGDSRDYYDRSPSRFDNRLVDSGIENDFRKDSSGEIHRRHRAYESDEDVRNTSMFLDSERRHTEDNYPGEQIYANTEYLKYKKYKDNGFGRERSVDDGSRFDPKLERYEKSPSRIDDKVSAKPPKAKKLSGLEKMKQLFSRDSSKKSKKEKEVQPKNRTRVLKSPEHLARDDSEYRRYTDPEPSEIIVRKVNQYECSGDERRLRSSREDLDRYRSPEIRDSDVERKHPEYDRYRSPENRDSDLDRKHREYDDRYNRSPENRESDIERKHREYDDRFERKVTEERKYQEYREEKRRYNSSERESDRPSDGEIEPRSTRSRIRPMDSPALAERYRERRRLATPSPTPSPPRRPPPASGSWFKSLDRLTRKKAKSNKVEKESVLTAEDDPRKVWSKPKPALNSPAKNLRFFGDTDQDSNASHSTVTKSKSHPVQKTHGTLRKTISNSTTGVDEIDSTMLSNKSYSLTNLQKEDHTRYKRNLQNISENHSNSETESHFDRKTSKKPPINPYDRSRSQSSSKTLKADRRTVERGSVSDVRRPERGTSSSRPVDRVSSNDVRRPIDRGSSTDVRRPDRGSSTDVRRPNDRGSSSDIRRTERGSSTERRRAYERGSSSELRSGKQESRESKLRRRTPATNSGESSTEGDSSHQSQRSVVYLHATTVGDIPDPGRITRNRSRDDVSSVNSSNLQVRTTTKSFSIFAPWTPKHYSENQDVHYAQRPRKPKEMKKAASTKTLNDERPLQKNKSYSQTTLSRRPVSSRLTSSNTTLNRKPDKRKETQSTLRKSVAKDGKKSQSSEIISRDNDRDRVSRSVSMPKDGKKAGWFKLSSKNKKPEVNSRVR